MQLTNPLGRKSGVFFDIDLQFIEWCILWDRDNFDKMNEYLFVIP